MSYRIKVFCTLQFEGFHRWKDAPDVVAFLRDYHRHIFHVRCELAVDHTERDKEFILAKRAVSETIHLVPYEHADHREWSCERWACYLLERFPEMTRCEVSEDGENGAVVERA